LHLRPVQQLQNRCSEQWTRPEF
ncbi:hypothetical protein S40285_09478, partial [Stachybotrys chlorohalonatus IBT 40285]